MEWIDWLLHGGRYLTATLTLLTALLASGHAIIWKRDSRSAVSWIVVIWLVPLAGTLLYLLLGINRIERRATALRRAKGRAPASPRDKSCAPSPSGACAVPEALVPLANLVGQLVPRALLPGNRIEPLLNGEHAYPAMLAAIDGARVSLALATYIFNLEGIGQQFVEALSRAVRAVSHFLAAHRGRAADARSGDFRIAEPSAARSAISLHARVWRCARGQGRRFGNRRSLKSIAHLFALLFRKAAAQSSAIVFVKAGAGGANNGASWWDAHTNLQDALAVPGVTERWVAASAIFIAMSGPIHGVTRPLRMARRRMMPAHSSPTPISRARAESRRQSHHSSHTSHL